ncbi:hypothetical protein [Granulosicoccus antarcticus]|uniref:Transposase IS4-like domain-containing protein n=1 Tax=Granulosicoccus antarcticus IMCC3135 TaxID=1192854 RepID=A0A2Z2NM60_9GAMM|nr:hypothetical protein [Granulosicoccus antarcticus]ASJ72269.1 hypothetical protein IMCC3135_10885 [Granulosicoccus antarcticus IMCC3135]
MSLTPSTWPTRSGASHGDETIIGNLRQLYRLDKVASGSQISNLLDLVKPSELRKAFRALHSSAQRDKVLEDFAIFDNRYLLSIDGTGLHTSTKMKCSQCGVTKHRNAEIEYYQQSLVAVIVDSEKKSVLPLDFEPIVKSDGDKKNDCERSAAKRLLLAINQQYCNRPFVVLEDALAANDPHIQTLIGYGMDFIINTKPVGNAPLPNDVKSLLCLLTVIIRIPPPCRILIYVGRRGVHPFRCYEKGPDGMHPSIDQIENDGGADFNHFISHLQAVNVVFLEYFFVNFGVCDIERSKEMQDLF